MFYKKINFHRPAWNINFDIPESGPTVQEIHYKNVEEIVPIDLLEKLKAIDQEPEYVRIFVWPKNYCGIWHIDGVWATTRYCAMNWILQGSGIVQFNGNMQDWEARTRKNYLTTVVESESIADGYLINTGVPHRVITQEDGRVTISLAWKSKDIPFAGMVEKLSKIGLV